MTVITGKAGEAQIASELTRNGWLVIHRNWRTRQGEIDLIAAEGDTIVFIEVKTWPHSKDIDLDLVINCRKQKRMIETAKCFLDMHRQYNDMYVRFDVILVLSDPGEGKKLQYEHFRNAFSECV
ncbi:YraN family protein [Brucepastera parasyntrophica]|uniref:YraN family protein n=1 Tax=Brucepastera parasyntrophica TaxID=2880008 RepID=UPI00210BAF17|nr:YraN family protein [Brucepastera parasyntrophica]ULQ59606.1 YraN family protein [Brucepastera parasyntrophica]